MRRAISATVATKVTTRSPGRPNPVGLHRVAALWRVLVVAAHVARGNRHGAMPVKYLLLIYQNEAVILILPKEERGQMHAAYLAYPERVNSIADGA